MIMNLASAQSTGLQLAQTILRNFSPAHTVQPLPIRYRYLIYSTSPTHLQYSLLVQNAAYKIYPFFLWAGLNCRYFIQILQGTYTPAVLEAVLWLRKYFFRIRTPGSVNLNSGRPINYGSGRIRILPGIAW
jgi:hypothetical protein